MRLHYPAGRRLSHCGSPPQLLIVYEAGPCGYGLARQLCARGYRCEVIAPTLIPRKPGDRIKTDRRGALALAHFARAGDLTPVVGRRRTSAGSPLCVSPIQRRTSLLWSIEQR